MKRPIVWVVAAVLLSGLLAAPGLAQSTAGAASLLITPGARADAMGRANVALPNDATATWWNPAALAWQHDRIISLMHTQLVPDLADDVYFEHLAFTTHWAGWGGVGASLIYLGYGKSQAISADDVYLGDFTSYEISPQISIGTELLPGLAAGTTLKYVYVNLAPSWATPDGEKGTGDTFGVDLAVLFDSQRLGGEEGSFLPIPIRLGVNVQNLGPDIAYIDEDQADPIGRNLKAGLGLQFLDTEDWRFLTSYDFNKSLVYSDEKPIHNAGAEVVYSDFLAGRFGYVYDKQGDIRDPTFGVGFTIGLGQASDLVLDYASVPQARVLDRVNKFSISFRF